MPRLTMRLCFFAVFLLSLRPRTLGAAEVTLVIDSPMPPPAWALLGNNIVDAPRAIWDDGRRLWSLLDIMTAVDVCGLAVSVRTLEGVRSALEARRADGEIAVGGDERQRFCTLLDSLAESCESSGLQETKHIVDSSRSQISDDTYRADLSTLASACHSILSRLTAELAERRFLLVKKEHVELIDRSTPFGGAVLIKFPSATEDIRAAAHCLAAGLPTASVFHSMRVVEVGLRALAKDRRIKIPKNIPIDLASWEEIIREVEEVERRLSQDRRTHAREEQYQFYHGAMLQVRAFKNVFRNRIMHKRETFGEGQASDVYDQVKRFMVILAGKLSEYKRTPQVWRAKRQPRRKKA